MSDDVIEPSEIFVEQRKGTVNEDTVHVNPWLRLVARFFDYSLFFLLLLLLRHFLGGHLPFGRYEYLVPFEYFVWIPFEAILLCTWGTTPGKWFLKIKLQHGAKKKPNFMTALKRSFNVWFRGLGMGIPVVNFICLLVAYHRLKVYRKTSWDRDDHIVVTHAPTAKWRFFVAAVIAIVGLLFYFHEKREEIASFSIEITHEKKRYNNGVVCLKPMQQRSGRESSSNG